MGSEAIELKVVLICQVLKYDPFVQLFKNVI